MYEFADLVALPDARFRGFALVLQILRGKTNRNEWKNMRACADSCLAIHDAVRLQTNAVPQLNLIANYRIRTDVAVAANVRAAADNSRRVNVSGMRCSGHGSRNWELGNRGNGNGEKQNRFLSVQIRSQVSAFPLPPLRFSLLSRRRSLGLRHALMSASAASALGFGLAAHSLYARPMRMR